MNPAKQKRIESAAVIAHATRAKAQALGMRAVPTEFEEAKKAAIEFALAQGELYEAEMKLNEAIRSN